MCYRHKQLYACAKHPNVRKCTQLRMLRTLGKRAKPRCDIHPDQELALVCPSCVMKVHYEEEQMFEQLKAKAEAEDRDITDEELAELFYRASPVSQQFKRFASYLGSLGGQARQKALSAKRRREIAKLAAETRWKKQKRQPEK